MFRLYLSYPQTAEELMTQKRHVWQKQFNVLPIYTNGIAKISYGNTQPHKKRQELALTNLSDWFVRMNNADALFLLADHMISRQGLELQYAWDNNKQIYTLAEDLEVRRNPFIILYSDEIFTRIEHFEGRLAGLVGFNDS